MEACDVLLARLEDKDTAAAYAALLALEKQSDENGCLYPHIHRFAAMTADKKYAVRVRGFRLLCKQARWDTENLLGTLLGPAMKLLTDEKPTAVRQALAALGEVAQYRPELRAQIRRAAENIDPMKYQESMQGLIAKDVQELIWKTGKA